MLKIYGMLWAMIGILAVLLLVTGNFTSITLIAFGFVSFGMIFMGMISVLPSTVVHHVPAEPKIKPEKATAKEDRIFHAKHLATR